MDFRDFAYYVGILTLVGFAIRMVSKLMGRFAYAKTGRRVQANGSWAVVTGATEGIGKAMAKVLLKKGMKVALVGRNAEKLEATKAELGATKTVQIDLSSASAKDYERVGKELKALDADGGIGVLVNNAGLSYDHPDYLQDVPIEHLRNLVTLNCQAVVELTHLVLPLMLARKKGAIMNMGSVSGWLPPNGLLTVYSASKSFVEYFSRGLAQEVASKGINVHCCIPAFVATKMSKMRPSLICPKPEVFAATALATLEGGQPQSIPYWTHSLQMQVANLLPTFLLEKYLFGMHLDIRKRALRKKEREASKGK